MKKLSRKNSTFIHPDEEAFHFLSPHHWLIVESAPKEVRDEITQAVDSLQLDINSAKSHNTKLAGQIKEEYTFTYGKEFTNFFQELLYKYENDIKENHWHDLTPYNFSNWLTGDQFTYVNPRTKKSDTLGWVNFQRKGEHNPIHLHGGNLSFIYYHKVPYSREMEEKAAPSLDSTSEIANGCTTFVFPTPFPKDRSYKDNTSIGLAGKAFEVSDNAVGTMCLFPAYLQHLVYPFYSSDDYRITLSGNVIFRKDNTLL